jgi:hypothetical protein
VPAKVHLGPMANGIERKCRPSRKGAYNRWIEVQRQALDQALIDRAMVDRDMQGIGKHVPSLGCHPARPERSIADLRSRSSMEDRSRFIRCLNKPFTLRPLFKKGANTPKVHTPFRS